jgi:small subunit ribosomal protein S20
MLGLSRHLQNKDLDPWRTPPKPASAPGKRSRPTRNASLKSTLRTAVKKVRKAIAAGDKAAAAVQLQASQAVIDRIADKRIMHKNTASRTKSRLSQAIKAMA